MKKLCFNIASVDEHTRTMYYTSLAWVYKWLYALSIPAILATSIISANTATTTAAPSTRLNPLQAQTVPQSGISNQISQDGNTAAFSRSSAV